MNKKWVTTFYQNLIEAELSDSNAKIEECLNFKKQHLPRFIYKYRSCNNFAYNDLFNNFVHLSYSNTFNDPLDCSSICTYEQALLLSLLKEEESLSTKDEELFFSSKNDFWPNEYRKYVKTELLKGKPYKPIMIKRLLEWGAFSKWEAQNYYKKFKRELDEQVLILSEEFKNKFLLCSFAATVKNNLMWSHYANCHTGFCVEYDISTLEENSPLLHALYPVIYTKTPLLSNINAIYYTDSTKDMLTLMNKSFDWSYEQEYRLLCYGKNQNYFMPNLPSRIFLGLKINKRNQDKIMKFAKKYHIEVRKMKINASSFDLSHERVY